MNGVNNHAVVRGSAGPSARSKQAQHSGQVRGSPVRLLLLFAQS